MGCLRLGFKIRDPDHSGPEVNLSPTVFAQILAGLDANELSRAAARFPMPRASRALSAYDHFAAMVAERGAGSALGRPVRLSLGRDRPAAQKNLLLSLGKILQVMNVKFS